jgi:hypothetical protein
MGLCTKDIKTMRICIGRVVLLASRKRPARPCARATAMRKKRFL